MRLDVSLMDGLGAEHFLDDDVGFREALLDVAKRHLGVAGDVALVVFMKLGCAVRDCFFDRCDRRQHLVLDINQCERFLRGVDALRCDCGDCMPFVEGPATGEDVVAEVFQIRRRTGNYHPCLVRNLGEVRRSYDCEHSRVRLCLAGV